MPSRASCFVATGPASALPPRCEPVCPLIFEARKLLPSSAPGSVDLFKHCFALYGVDAPPRPKARLGPTFMARVRRSPFRGTKQPFDQPQRPTATQ